MDNERSLIKWASCVINMFDLEQNNASLWLTCAVEFADVCNPRVSVGTPTLEKVAIWNKSVVRISDDENSPVAKHELGKFNISFYIFGVASNVMMCFLNYCCSVVGWTKLSQQARIVQLFVIVHTSCKVATRIFNQIPKPRVTWAGKAYKCPAIIKSHNWNVVNFHWKLKLLFHIRRFQKEMKGNKMVTEYSSSIYFIVNSVWLVALDFTEKNTYISTRSLCWFDIIIVYRSRILNRDIDRLAVKQWQNVKLCINIKSASVCFLLLLFMHKNTLLKWKRNFKNLPWLEGVLFGKMNIEVFALFILLPGIEVNPDGLTTILVPLSICWSNF